MTIPVCPYCNESLKTISATRKEEITKQFVYIPKKDHYKLDYVIDKEPLNNDYDSCCPYCDNDISDIINNSNFEDLGD